VLARVLLRTPPGGASFTHELKALLIQRAARALGRLAPPKDRSSAGKKRYDMTDGTAADFARRHVEGVINGRRLDPVDELYAPGAVYNDPVAPGGTAQGRQEIKAFFSAIFQAMPDVRFTIADNFGTADRGLCRGTISATLRGDFGPLPATGKSATAPLPRSFGSRSGRSSRSGSTPIR
jgi:SnoaL-like polyketide cyclase